MHGTPRALMVQVSSDTMGIEPYIETFDFDRP